MTDPRIILIQKKNGGVGSAIKVGHRELIEKNCELLVVVSGDNQMDQELMPLLLDKFASDLSGPKVLFAKGNRLSSSQLTRGMPFFRKCGNYFFSICTWIFFKVYIPDPLNGYTCITSSLYEEISGDAIGDGYEYEISLIINLIKRNIQICEIPMQSIYRDEVSNISPISTPIKIFWQFLRLKRGKQIKKFRIDKL
jgi:hypothetical protein